MKIQEAIVEAKKDKTINIETLNDVVFWIELHCRRFWRPGEVTQNLLELREDVTEILAERPGHSMRDITIKYLEDKFKI